MGEEAKALTSALNSFFDYAQTAQFNIIKVRRRKLDQLKFKYSTAAAADPANSARPAVNYYELAAKVIEPLLDTLADCIENNGFFLETVAQIASVTFDAPDQAFWEESSIAEISKAVSLLGQLAREWSIEGIAEREVSLGRVIAEIERLYPELEDDAALDEYLTTRGLARQDLTEHELRQAMRNRAGVKIVVPGCGLGRLPLELAARGFAAEGNEVSFAMLFTSNFLLNHTAASNEYRLNPWIHSFSHVRDRESQIRAVLVPDVHPGEFLTRRERAFGKPAGELSMVAGSFDEVYSEKTKQEARVDLSANERRPARHEEKKEDEEAANGSSDKCNQQTNGIDQQTPWGSSGVEQTMHGDTNFLVEQKDDKVCSSRNSNASDKEKDGEDSNNAGLANGVDPKGHPEQGAGDKPDDEGSCGGNGYGQVDVVATVFFIDTSPNIFQTLDTISRLLRPGGQWINYGPLLWHYEHSIPAFSFEPLHTGDAPADDVEEPQSHSHAHSHVHSHAAEEDDRTAGLELSLTELLGLLPSYGLRVVKRESSIPTTYAVDTMSMRGHMYNCEYWVAVKD